MSAVLPENIAAVDLGSNSFHMKVARVIEGRLHTIDRMKEMVRLAGALGPDDTLTESGSQRALDCLGRFGQRLREFPEGSVRAVGTNTLRRARNAVEFMQAAQEALGHPIEIIAGREEARLIYSGVAHTIAPDNEQRLVVDIGGGSTEFVIGRHYTPILTESLYMGCVGMHARHFKEGNITAEEMAAAEFSALQELEPILEPYRRVGWDHAVGSSGTIKAVGRVLELQGWASGGISRAGLRHLREALIAAGRTERLSLAGLQAERVPVFPGGVAILSSLMSALQIKQINVSDGALREGVLFEMVGRMNRADVRESTIHEFSHRNRVDSEQAERVEKTALYLHEQVAQPWRLRKELYGRLLGWAARLHEIGLAIAHSQHHKHGAYILEHADLPGFSRQEQSMLAALVRAHRQRFPREVFEGLAGTCPERALRLAILLRVAVALNRSRTDTHLLGLRAEAEADTLRLQFPDGWLGEHPLTAADLLREANLLAAANLRLLLE